jgi:hypothetical protein
MGPDHPQIEIFNESKHGIAYRKNADKLGIDKKSWVLGKDYSAAPTCSSCHMGAVAPRGNSKGLKSTHDVGARISWTLRPKISYKPKGIKDKDGNVILKEPEGRRNDMKQACLTCHGKTWVNNFYKQYDQAVELYNDKFGTPAKAIYEYLIKVEVLDKIKMNEDLDYIYFEVWHHEGRRARMGASMMAPDYTQWHGFYEITKHFYSKFLPKALKAAKEKGKSKEVKAFIKKQIGKGSPNYEKYHKYMKEGLSKEEREKWLKEEKALYDKR